MTSVSASACASAAPGDNAANASATKAVPALMNGRSGCSVIATLPPSAGASGSIAHPLSHCSLVHGTFAPRLSCEVSTSHPVRPATRT
jgi:hypothetical protein